jgi:hypothetical protein
VGALGALAAAFAMQAGVDAAKLADDLRHLIQNTDLHDEDRSDLALIAQMLDRISRGKLPRLRAGERVVLH